MFHVVAYYGTRPGATGQVPELLYAMAEATGKEPGNISYDYFRGVQDPSQIVILESCRDADDDSAGTGKANTSWSLAPQRSFRSSIPAASPAIPPR